MARLLISAVGNRDPYASAGVDGPILTTVTHLQPDEVHLLFSASPNRSSMVREARETQEVIEKQHRATAFLHPLDLPDPTDYDAILGAFRQFASQIREKHHDDEIMVAISSGTPAMQGCWLLLISQRELPGLPFYTSDPQFVEEGKIPVRGVSIGFLQEDALLKISKQHYQNFHFYSASRALKNLSQASPDADRRQRAEILSRYCEALALWDDYRLKEAKGKLREAERWFPTARVKREVLEQLVSDQKRSTTEESILIFTDLFHNAERCFRRGQYADALARTMRTYEGVLKWWLRNHHGVPGNLNELEIGKREKIKKFLDKRSLRLDPRGHLMRHAVERLLLEFFGDKSIESWIQKLDPLAELRNSSIVAHGTQEVAKAKAAEGLAILKELLVECGCNLDEYPMASEKLLSESISI